MATTRKLTWDAMRKRWKKKYKGRQLYLGSGRGKSDDASYQLALEQFDLKRAEIDRELEASKPHQADYATALKLRREMLDWLQLNAADAEQYDQHIAFLRQHSGQGGQLDGRLVREYLDFDGEQERLLREIEQLNRDFARVNPPQLDRPGTLPTDPLVYRPIPEQMVWRERLDSLRDHHRWTQAKDPANTVEANIEQFLKQRQEQAHAGQISGKRFDCCKRGLKLFETFIGPLPIEQFSPAKHLTAFHIQLHKDIEAGRYSKPYAKTILADVKHFITWLWENEVIENLPRNFRRLCIELDVDTPQTIPIAIIKTLLTGAGDRTKLYILLMLNCGFTQKDIADLEQKEVDWSRGRILRKRSKAKKRKTCPVVNYKSWDETFRLLKQFRSNDATLVLLNERGKPLRSLTLKEDGKLRTNDSVRKALVALCKKLKIEQPPPKGFRKTSSTLVFNAKQFRGLDALFLGQSPKSVADIHYNAVGETILDEAIDYLAVQYGIK